MHTHTSLFRSYSYTTIKLNPISPIHDPIRTPLVVLSSPTMLHCLIHFSAYAFDFLLLLWCIPGTFPYQTTLNSPVCAPIILGTWILTDELITSKSWLLLHCQQLSELICTTLRAQNGRSRRGAENMFSAVCLSWCESCQSHPWCKANQARAARQGGSQATSWWTGAGGLFMINPPAGREQSEKWFSNTIQPFIDLKKYGTESFGNHGNANVSILPD